MNQHHSRIDVQPSALAPPALHASFLVLPTHPAFCFLALLHAGPGALSALQGRLKLVVTSFHTSVRLGTEEEVRACGLLLPLPFPSSSFLLSVFNGRRAMFRFCRPDLLLPLGLQFIAFVLLVIALPYKLVILYSTPPIPRVWLITDHDRLCLKTRNCSMFVRISLPHLGIFLSLF